MTFLRKVNKKSFSIHFIIIITICGSVFLPPIQGEVALKFNEDIHRVQHSGAGCVEYIADNFFDQSSTICIVTSGFTNITNFQIAKTTDQLITQRLMARKKWNMMMKRMDFVEKVHNYIIFLKSEVDINVILKMLTDTQSWNPHANFLIYMDRLSKEWEYLTNYYIKQLWKYFVINVTLLIPDPVNYTQRILTWFPYDENNCGKEERNFVYIGDCLSGKIVPKSAVIFPEKVPLNLNGCPVKIKTVFWPPFVIPPKIPQTFGDNELLNVTAGVEIDVIRTIAQQANFTPQFSSFHVPENWGVIHPNGSLSGLMEALFLQRAEIAIGRLTPTLERHKIFDFTIQYMEEHTAWVVPVSDLIPKWRMLFLIFQPEAWLMSFIAYFVVSLVTLLLARSKSEQIYENMLYQKMSGTLFLTFCMLVGNVLPVLPKSTRIRLFIFFWGMFSLHWYTAYTTSLVSMLTTQIYDEQLATFKDIQQLRMNYSMTIATTYLFEKEKIGAEILRNTDICKTSPECLQRVASDKNFAMAINRQYFEFTEQEYQDENGNSKVRAISENIVSSPVEMLLIKGNPMLSRINTCLLRIVQGGLIDFWLKTIRHVNENKMMLQKIGRSGNNVLTLYHLQGAFIVLLIGLLLSLCVFIGEHIYSTLR